MRPVASDDLEEEAPTRVATLRSTAIKLVGAALAGAALAILFSPGHSRPPAAAATSGTPAPAPRGTVHVTIRATPLHARVVIDHNPFDNPCVATMPMDRGGAPSMSRRTVT